MAKTKQKVCTVVINKDYCKGCSLCIEYCKKGVLKFSDDFNIQGYRYAVPQSGIDCIGCMVCVLVCPEVAIEVYDG